MLETINNLTFRPLSQAEKQQRGILGRLSGPVASCVTATRNGRKYTEELWEKAFNNPIVQEMFKNGGIGGELGHPEDRDETDISKIAIMMPEAPKKDKNGQLVTYVDILDTPCGQIAYQLAKYGFKFGISSRGTGEVNEDWSGDETVDPDSYQLNAFDLVLLPACKTARLTFTESYNLEKPFRQSLTEALDQASAEDRKIMEDVLNELKIDYSTEDESISESVEDIQEEPKVEDTNVAAEDNGAEIVEALQEALQAKIELEKQVKALQEKLSVCYTKEARYSKTLTKTKTELNEAIEAKDNLTNVNESLQSKVNDLETELKDVKESFETHKRRMVGVKHQLKESISSKSNLDADISKLNEDINSLNKTNHSLSESLVIKEKKISSLTEALTSLQESYNKVIKDHDVQVSSLKEELQKSKIQTTTLQEQLEEVQKDSKIIKSQATAKIERAEKLTERYKNIASTAVDKYILVKAQRLGVKVEDIKSKLNENYSFNDIDRVCEGLQQYKLNINSLPFSTDRPLKMKITESKKPTIISTPTDNRIDDEIDETLKSFL